MEETSAGKELIRNSKLIKSKKKIPKRFYVYIAVVDGVIHYVGKGSTKRYSHVNSGTSSSYELNKEHFNGVTFDVYIVADDLDEQDAFLLETKLILEIKPPHNKVTKRPLGKMSGIKSEGTYCMDLSVRIPTKVSNVVRSIEMWQVLEGDTRMWLKVILTNLLKSCKVHYVNSRSNKAHKGLNTRKLRNNWMHVAIDILVKEGLVESTWIDKVPHGCQMPSFLTRTELFNEKFKEHT